MACIDGGHSWSMFLSMPAPTGCPKLATNPLHGHSATAGDSESPRMHESTRLCYDDDDDDDEYR